MPFVPRCHPFDLSTPEHHLELRFLDINMAGECEPEARAGFDDVRVMRAAYPPSFPAEYALTDSSGEVVATGRRRISDPSFQYVASFRSDEPLFHETELATDLLRDVTRSI